MTQPKASQYLRIAVLALACTLSHAAADARGWLVQAQSKEEAHQHTRRAMLEHQEQGHDLMATWWDDWKGYYAKQYASPDEDAKAFAAFQDNMRAVHDVNANLDLSYWASGNKFSDLTWDQFKAQHLLKLAYNGTTTLNATVAPTESLEGAEEEEGASAGRKAVPGGNARRRLQAQKLDWRQKGIVTPVRNQGSCDSCWLMAGTHALEAAYQISQNLSTPVQFSPQQALDCFNVGTCYYGGAAEMMNAITQQSITLESLYPLTSDKTGVQGKCKKSLLASLKPGQSVQMSPGAGYERLEGAAERTLIARAQLNPLVMHYEVDIQFMNYAGGVYTAQTCTGDALSLNHAMVAFGFDLGAGWWNFKNSWGPNWGENGYARIKMIGGVGTCGLYRWAFRPSLEFSTTLNAAAVARKPKRALRRLQA